MGAARLRAAPPRRLPARTAADRRVGWRATNDRPFAYFTTVTVTTTLVTSPVIRSAAAVNSVDCPSFKISGYRIVDEQDLRDTAAPVPGDA